MYCNKFRKLRPLTSVSVHQNIISVSEITISSQMQAVKLPSIHGVSHTRGLRPHPPPQKKVNGSSLSADEQFLIFGLRSREDKTGEEVRAFIREGRQGRPAPGTRPTGARGQTCLPPLSVQRTVFQPISEYKADILQSRHWKIDTLNKTENLHAQAQQISQEERDVSQTELRAKQDWVNYEASLQDSNPLKNEQKAQDSLVKRLKLEKEEKALLRKICRVQDTIEIEEMYLREEREECVERDSNQSPEDLEKCTWEYTNAMSLSEEKDEVLKYCENEKEKLKNNVDRMKEEIQNMALCIEQEQEKQNKLKAEVEMINSYKGSRRMKKRTKTEQLCEELAKVTESYGEQAYSPSYPLMILLQFEDWILDSLDLIENMPAEKLCKLQKQIFKHYENSEQEQKRIRREALLEERRQKRLARALCPSAKPTGKKLMPRSQPLKNIRKTGTSGKKEQEGRVIRLLCGIIHL